MIKKILKSLSLTSNRFPMATRTDFHLSAAATGYPGFQTLILCLSSTQSKLQCSLKRKQNFFFSYLNKADAKCMSSCDFGN